MDFPDSVFDEKQLSVLKTAFDLCCTELGIAETDENSRTSIAKAMMSLATVGQYDIERLKVYAMSKVKAR